MAKLMSAVITSGLLVACASSPAEPTERPIRAELREGRVFEFPQTPGEIAVHTYVSFDHYTHVTEAVAPLEGGVAVAMVDDDGRLVLDAVTVNVGSYMLDEEVAGPDARARRPPDFDVGRVLIGGMRLGGEDAMVLFDTDWAWDGDAVATAASPQRVTLTWTAREGRQPIEKFSRLTQLDVSAFVERTDDGLHLLVTAGSSLGHPMVWRFAGVTFATTVDFSLHGFSAEE